MEELEQKIREKIDLVIKQYSIKGNLKVYIPLLKKRVKEFFDNDLEARKKALEHLKELLLSYRIWEDAYSDYFADTSDKYKDKFVNGFNNWSEWYAFLESIVKDAEEYYDCCCPARNNLSKQELK